MQGKGIGLGCAGNREGGESYKTEARTITAAGTDRLPSTTDVDADLCNRGLYVWEE